MFVTVENCARCGSYHEGLEFHEFTRPIECGDVVYQYFATCPAYVEPILMSVYEDMPPFVCKEEDVRQC